MLRPVLRHLHGQIASASSALTVTRLLALPPSPLSLLPSRLSHSPFLPRCPAPRRPFGATPTSSSSPAVDSSPKPPLAPTSGSSLSSTPPPVSPLGVHTALKPVAPSSRAQEEEEDEEEDQTPPPPPYKYKKELEGVTFYALDQSAMRRVHHRALIPLATFAGSMGALSLYEWPVAAMCVWVGAALSSLVNAYALSGEVTRMSVIAGAERDRRPFPRVGREPVYTPQAYVLETYGFPFSDFRQKRILPGLNKRMEDPSHDSPFVIPKETRVVGFESLFKAKRIIVRRSNEFSAVFNLDQITSLDHFNQLLMSSPPEMKPPTAGSRPGAALGLTKFTK